MSARKRLATQTRNEHAEAGASTRAVARDAPLPLRSVSRCARRPRCADQSHSPANEKGWCRTVFQLQGSLHATLSCFPDHGQVVLSFACSVTSLSLFPSHYLPGRPCLRRGVLADYLFGRGSPSTWCAGRTTVHGAPSATPPLGAQRGITLPRWKFAWHRCCTEMQQSPGAGHTEERWQRGSRPTTQ